MLFNDMAVSICLLLFIFMMMMIIIGILGLCAIVLASPYDIPTYVPYALMLLCKHSHDPDIIQVWIFH